MKEYFARLSPLERRFVVIVGVAVFVVLNLWFVWPHFKDWDQKKFELQKARLTTEKFQKEIANKATYQKALRSLEGGEGAVVPPEDQGVDLIRTIQNTAIQNGLALLSNTRLQPRTNDQFYVELGQAVNVQGTDKAIVNFLFALGESSAMIRVRDLSLRPDPPRQQLTANMKLVASYQKKAPTRAAAPSSRSATKTR